MTAATPHDRDIDAAHHLVPPVLLAHHPAAPEGPSLDIAVSIGNAAHLPGGGWRLRYEIRGELADMLLPEPTTPGPADGLWQHTCFEAFVAEKGADGYQEFNFSPSGQWASYLFSDERIRDTAAESGSTAKFHPPIAVKWLQLPDAYVLEALIPAAARASNGSGQPLDLGLSAVIESRKHGLTYWAYRHPGPKPDFHDRRGFALQVPETPHP